MSLLATAPLAQTEIVPPPPFLNPQAQPFYAFGGRCQGKEKPGSGGTGETKETCLQNQSTCRSACQDCEAHELAGPYQPNPCTWS